MHQIAAVTFDLWQTLILDTRENGITRSKLRLSGTRDILESVDLDYSISELQKAYDKCSIHCREIREHQEDISFVQQVDIFIGFIDPNLRDQLPDQAVKQIRETYCNAFFSHPPLPHPNSVEVLEAIQNMDLKLGMISNTGMTPGYAFREFLRQHNMLNYFDTLTFSDEVAVSKPSKKIFDSTLHELNVSPQEAVHIGDHPVTDVNGAKSAGLHTIWIEGFYEPDELDIPGIKADINVKDLKDVPSAITQLRTPSQRAS